MPKQITMVKWSAKDIPYGVAFDENTGTFSGSPLNAGDYIVPVTVQTNYGTDTKNVALNIEDLKNQWREFTVDTGIALQGCIDNGKEIIFFGNSNKKGGIFFTYNPSNNTYSDIYRLIDGEKYSDDPDWSSYIFKSCVQDPVSKKWLAFFGKNYVRTPSGVKDLGTDVNFYNITTCWAGNLQKFCVIGVDSKGEKNSYLFDIDGNLLDKSSAISLISDYSLPSTGTTRASDDDVLCWSDKENKFITKSSGTNGVIAYSSDGLNWEKSTIYGSFYQHTTNLIYRLETLGLFIVTSGGITVSGSSGVASSSIYTSSDGLTWTKIDSPKNFLPVNIAWSNSKNALCLVGYYGSSYITKDLINWELIKMPVTIQQFGDLIWSDTANAFISPQGGTNKFYRLKI